MNKNQYQKKMAIYVLLASGATFLASNSFAKTETPKTHPATTIDRVSAATKHKLLKEKIPSIEGEAAEIEAETQKAIVALGGNDTKGATTILQGVSTKLDNLLAKNPGLNLVPAKVETDVYDFNGTNKQVAYAIDAAEDMLKHGKLQNARKILVGMASEIRVTTTNIPLGSYPAAIKQIIPLIDSGKIDQAVVDLSSVLGTLVVTTEVMPLPVLRAEELLTVAADLEHRDDLSKEANRNEIQKFTDAAKDKLELAQLLGYGEKDDYKTLYKEIDAIHKTLFSEQSAAVWQKVMDDLGQFKDRLKDLEDAAERIGHPAK
ncbi:YfdX family protein [Methyloglobulus sp.]|uniref:YfdX family protein n=1 Tax=Methyloglobulus sp. TaxID=2518622 RepID=UPI00398928B6